MPISSKICAAAIIRPCFGLKTNRAIFPQTTRVLLASPLGVALLTLAL